MLLRQRISDTMTALAFTLFAIAAPCAAWYIVGSREANRRAAELEDAPRRQAHEVAANLAERLRDRLETLRANESHRPFYHYQNLYHDPRGAYEGIAVVPSPLSEGPMDPLILTYFQLDASGRLTLPQLAEAGQESATPQQESSGELSEIRRQLELQVPTYVSVVRDDVRKQLAPAAARSLPQQQAAATRRVETLDSQVWAQNVQASDVYFNLRNPEKATPRSKDELEKIRGGKGQVQIVVGALRWHNTTINKLDSLVALRDVQTPQGRLLQGFLISPEGILDVLKASPFPAQFRPGLAVHDTDGAIRLDDNLWHVSVDAHLDLADARSQARAIRRGFLRVFSGSVAVAAVAGVFVVWLVWQSERLARQRSQFAASAAHELRTPLAGLRMYGEMLAEGLGDPTRSKDYARRLAEEAARLGRVVSNVLGFTRLERGTLKIHPERGDLTAVVRDCVERQRPSLEAAGARVELTIAPDVPTVGFDRDAVAEIIQNLLDNAEKHTRSANNRTIDVSLAATDHHVALTIRDHGAGIPANVKRRLFRPFARGDHGDAPAGLGLGLVLVKALVRAHGGEITCSDAPDGGALFTVTLPR